MDNRFGMTRKKYQWILWSMAALLLLVGGLCLYSSFNAPPAKPEAAAELQGLAIWSVCFAVAVMGIERATTSFVRDGDRRRVGNNNE